jgi:hypothetical protein
MSSFDELLESSSFLLSVEHTQADDLRNYANCVGSHLTCNRRLRTVGHHRRGSNHLTFNRRLRTVGHHRRGQSSDMQQKAEDSRPSQKRKQSSDIQQKTENSRPSQKWKQSSDMQQKTEDSSPSQKMKREPVYGGQCDYVDVSDDSDSNVPSACEKKHKVKAIKLKNEQLDLQCE